MNFHYFTNKWKWFYGRYTPSGIRVGRKTMKIGEFEKKASILKKIAVRMKKLFFTKVSENRWIWHLYNVFRSAKPIQIQPINPNLINKREISKKNRICFENSRIFIFIFILVILLNWLRRSSHPCCASQGRTARSSSLRCTIPFCVPGNMQKNTRNTNSGPISIFLVFTLFLSKFG